MWRLFVDQAAFGHSGVGGLGLREGHELRLQAVHGAVELLEQFVQLPDVFFQKGEFDFEVGDSVIQQTPPQETIPLLVIVRPMA